MEEPYVRPVLYCCDVALRSKFMLESFNPDSIARMLRIEDVHLRNFIARYILLELPSFYLKPNEGSRSEVERC